MIIITIPFFFFAYYEGGVWGVSFKLFIYAMWVMGSPPYVQKFNLIPEVVQC